MVMNYTFVTTIIGIILFICMCIYFFLSRRNSNRDDSAEVYDRVRETSYSTKSQEIQSNIEQRITHLGGTQTTESRNTAAQKSSKGTDVYQSSPSNMLKSQKYAERSESLTFRSSARPEVKNVRESLKGVNRCIPMMSTTNINRKSLDGMKEENKSSTQRTEPIKLKQLESQRNAERSKSPLFYEESIKRNESRKSMRNTDHRNTPFVKVSSNISASSHPKTSFKIKTKMSISDQKQPRRFSLWQFQRIHENISLGDIAKSKIKEYYTNCVNVDSTSRDETWTYCEKIVRDLLKMFSKYGIVTAEPDIEGSLACGVKTGKADECDFSVEIRLLEKDKIILSKYPFLFVFEDDIDSFCGKPSGIFASDGKRFFTNVKKREHVRTSDPEPIRKGYVAVCLGDRDAKNLLSYCAVHSTKNKRSWVVPFSLLSSFYTNMKDCIDTYQRFQNDNAKIQLNEAVKGPAVTLTIMEEGVHNISVDITPKITLPSTVLRLCDFRWPRWQTKQWLNESVIENVLQQQLYLVPKGDKYWKISFANCENTLLAGIDDKGTWRKGCLRLMKKKLSLWRSKSITGLKGISSYHLKVTLLWLCENLPDDKLWTEDQLANRYLSFLTELNHRLKINHIGEYFNPKVNLLEGKSPEEVEEIKEFVQSEKTRLEEGNNEPNNIYMYQD